MTMADYRLMKAGLLKAIYIFHHKEKGKVISLRTKNKK